MFPVEITIPFLPLVTKWVSAVGQKKRLSPCRNLWFLSLIIYCYYIITMNIIFVGSATETAATTTLTVIIILLPEWRNEIA